MQTSEHLQALANGFGARAQALVRQGFPRRKLEQFEIVDEIAKSSRDILCFTTGGDNDKLHGTELFFGSQFRQKSHYDRVCAGGGEQI